MISGVKVLSCEIRGKLEAEPWNNEWHMTNDNKVTTQAFLLNFSLHHNSQERGSERLISNITIR